MIKDSGTFIGHNGETWALFIDHEWEVISGCVHECINRAKELGFTVDYEISGDQCVVRSVTKQELV